MNRISAIALVALIAAVVGACSDAPTTSTVTLGKTTLDEFFANDAWNSWFQTNYSSYPESSEQVAFNQHVADLAASIDPAAHRVVMVTKPSCGCVGTKLYMPRVMKALDEAGFPRANYDLYITDARLAGIDEVKAKYNIGDAPTFIILKNDVEKGRIALEPSPGMRIEQELAQIFAVQ